MWNQLAHSEWELAQQEGIQTPCSVSKHAIACLRAGLRPPELQSVNPRWICLPRCRAERVYNREEVLGRDATSVFPTEIAAAAAAERSAAADALGGRTFITETEVSGCLA